MDNKFYNKHSSTPESIDVYKINQPGFFRFGNVIIDINCISCIEKKITDMGLFLYKIDREDPKNLIFYHIVMHTSMGDYSEKFNSEEDMNFRFNEISALLAPTPLIFKKEDISTK